jgi:ElaB/YqjD/DUF883 family membrane-anchored ribosome-binding protein
MHRPILCLACRTHVQRRQIDPQFLPTLDNELDRLRKALYHRMTNLVKAQPIAALAITAAFGLVLNILASITFEKLKIVWPAIG